MIKKLLNPINKIYKSKYFPFIVLFFVIFFLHLYMAPNIMDDTYFGAVLDNSTLTDWLHSRYNVWSSRLLMETFLVAFLHINIIWWKIADSLIIVLLGYSLSKLFIKKDFRKNNWLITILIVLFPLELLSSSGWLTTTINYLWPLTMGLFALIPIKKILNNERISKIGYILYPLALIYGVNQEQMALVIFAICVLTFIYQLTQKKFNFYVLLMILISFTSLVFIMTCPGNYARFTFEINRWYIDYNMLSFIDKIVLGVTSTMSHFLLKPIILFVLTSAMLFTYVFNNYKKLSYRVIASIPFLSGILTSVFCNIAYVISISKGDAIDYYSQAFLLNATNFYNPLAYLPLILYLAVIGTFIISLYLVFKNTYKSVLTILIFTAGLCTRLIMGFSPTIFVSTYRPDIFMCFSIIICGLLIYNEMDDKHKYKKLIFNIMLALAAISFITNFIFISTYL